MLSNLIFLLFLQGPSPASPSAPPKVETPAPLQVEDAEIVSRAMLRMLNARVMALEALVDGRMGVAQNGAVKSTTEDYQKVHADMQKKYKAEHCTITMNEAMVKSWQCPEKPKEK